MASKLKDRNAFIWLVYLNVDPVFDSLRGKSDFEQLVKRMEFPELSGKAARVTVS